MQDGCSFVGTYKELRKHVKSEHPLAKPREVDPILEQKWRLLEIERERQDALSTITATMGRAIVFGDYVLDLEDEDDLDDVESDEDDNANGHGTDNTRRMLMFLMRQVARHHQNQRLQNAIGTTGGAEDNYAVSSGANATTPYHYPLEGDDEDDLVMAGGGSTGMVRPERRRRRRRRNRERLFLGAN